MSIIHNVQVVPTGARVEHVTKPRADISCNSELGGVDLINA
jgi:hypothetical protein